MFSEAVIQIKQYFIELDQVQSGTISTAIQVRTTKNRIGCRALNTSSASKYQSQAPTLNSVKYRRIFHLAPDTTLRLNLMERSKSPPPAWSPFWCSLSPRAVNQWATDMMLSRLISAQARCTGTVSTISDIVGGHCS